MSECRSPCLDRHRVSMRDNADNKVLDSLRFAWKHNSTWDTTERQKQDWATFRAITLREVRRRGLVIPGGTKKLIEKRGARVPL